MLSDKQFIFIIGSSRSGTTWLQIMVGAHPLVCSSVELTVFDSYVAPWVKAWKKEAAYVRQWIRGLPFIFSEEEFYGFLRDFVAKVYERVVINNPTATHIVDKRPAYAGYVQLINRFLPKSRFIHVIRDGRDAAASMLAARRRVGFGPDNIRDAAASWKWRVEMARQAEEFGGRYLEVRYEDLLARGPDVLKTVLGFCGLVLSDENITSIFEAHEFEKMKVGKMTPVKNVKAPDGQYWRGKSGNWREELDPMQRYVFDRIAGDLLQELGYAEKGWWAESPGQRVMLPALAALSRVRGKIALVGKSVFGSTRTRYGRRLRSRMKSSGKGSIGRSAQ